MKIAYWSPVHGQGRTTSNMAVMSLLGYLGYEYNTIMLDMNYGRRDLEHIFIGEPSVVVGEYFGGDIGIDAISRNMKVESLSKESIHNCSISIIEGGLHLLPATGKLQEALYEDRLLPVLNEVMYSIEAHYDVVAIDTNSGYQNKITRRILEISDMIVVNLPQNQLVLKEYFKLEPLKEYKHKMIYCIGAYSNQSKYNKFNLKRIYYSSIHSNIGVIPYNYRLMDEISSGNIVNYLEEKRSGNGSTEELFFIEECKKVLSLLEKKRSSGRRTGL